MLTRGIEIYIINKAVRDCLFASHSKFYERILIQISIDVQLPKQSCNEGFFYISNR